MAAKFTIKVKKLYTADENGLANVVKKIDWILVGEEDEFVEVYPPPLSTVTTCETDLSLDTAKYILFDNLTEKDVVSWIESKVDGPFLDALKQLLQSKLTSKISKKYLSSPQLPWATA